MERFNSELVHYVYHDISDKNKTEIGSMHFTAVPMLVENPPTKFSRLAVEVTIIGEEPASTIDVAMISRDPAFQGKSKIGGKEANLRGRCFSFESDEEGPLAGCCRYYLPDEYVNEVKAIVDTFSVDLIHIQIIVNNNKKVIDGRTISDFVLDL